MQDGPNDSTLVHGSCLWNAVPTIINLEGLLVHDAVHIVTIAHEGGPHVYGCNLDGCNLSVCLYTYCDQQ